MPLNFPAHAHFSAWDVVRDFLCVAASRTVDTSPPVPARMSLVLGSVDLEQDELLGC
jgi:hypothetical protein